MPTKTSRYLSQIDRLYIIITYYLLLILYLTDLTTFTAYCESLLLTLSLLSLSETHSTQTRCNEAKMSGHYDILLSSHSSLPEPIKWIYKKQHTLQKCTQKGDIFVMVGDFNDTCKDIPDIIPLAFAENQTLDMRLAKMDITHHMLNCTNSYRNLFSDSAKYMY